MHAHARDPYGSAPVRAHASAGRHGKTRGPAGEGELSFTQPFPDGPAGEGKFDFGRPFLVDIGRADVIADWLRESGYPRCTADVVTAELARPGRERSAIERLAQACWKRRGGGHEPSGTFIPCPAASRPRARLLADDVCPPGARLCRPRVRCGWRDLAQPWPSGR
jgi:hypothetical protein